MFGVVLWSDADDGKAVFWCEDQGDLAYFENRDACVDDHSVFDAGDMVQFDVVKEHRLRRAKNARLIQEKAYEGLPEHLRQNAATGSQSAKVLPFVLPQARQQQQSLPKIKCEG